MNELNVIQLNIKDIKPYDKNPRNNDKAVEGVANSIKEFGFLVPCVITKDNVLVTGHTRVKACKKLGIEQIPCVLAENLTEEQIKAFRLADNKVSEVATWNYELLGGELSDIFNIDMEKFGFELDIDIDTDLTEVRVLEKENERLRTDNAYNLPWNDIDRTDGWFQIPTLEPCSFIPTDLIGFNYLLTTERRECGIHFYLDDYQFERIWSDPETYIRRIQEFECALTPDFSLYTDMPRAMKIWNVYRSRLIGQIMQDMGINVIPTVNWAEKETYQFCFAGLPKHSVVSTSTISVKSDDAMIQMWKNGCDEMIKRLEPKAILLYGGRMDDYDFGDIEVIEYKNHVTEKMKESAANG